jgi:hypothetical protein
VPPVAASRADTVAAASGSGRTGSDRDDGAPLALRLFEDTKSATDPRSFCCVVRSLWTPVVRHSSGLLVFTSGGNRENGPSR